MPHDRLRQLNKHLINHLMRWLAYIPFGPIAVIYHLGRRSGKAYEATIMVQPADGQLVIALTYGKEVDWFRNLQAAGKALLLWHGKLHLLEKPGPMDAQQALRCYPPPQKWFLSKLGTQHFIKLGYQSASNPTGISASSA